MDLRTKVLVADDDFVTREFLGAILGHMGYSVTYVKNGKEALEIIKEQDFGAILMDMMMPELNGEETAWTLNGYLKNNTPIIAVTALQMKPSLLVKLGIKEFVPKPIIAGRLRDAIERVLKTTMPARIACA